MSASGGKSSCDVLSIYPAERVYMLGAICLCAWANLGRSEHIESDLLKNDGNTVVVLAAVERVVQVIEIKC
jgi:hypothetical protein